MDKDLVRPEPTLKTEPKPESTEPKPEPEPVKLDEDIKMTDTTTKDTDTKMIPKRYNGDRNLYPAFRDSIDLYFLLNADKYPEDDKKIALVLQLLDEGEARTWRTNFLRKKRKTANSRALTLGTYNNFITELDENFKRDNEEDEALFTLHRMRQKSDETAAQAITRFKEQAALAGVDLETNPRLAIDYLKNVLNPNLVDKISVDVNEPSDFEGWAKLACKYDTVWRRSKIMKGLSNRRGNFNRGSVKPFFRPPKRDPDAMDIDAMTTEKRDRLLKSGACFFCEEKGHISRDCPKKKKSDSDKPKNSNQPFIKRSPKETARYIRSILAQYSPEEEEEIQKAATELDDDEDF